MVNKIYFKQLSGINGQFVMFVFMPRAENPSQNSLQPNAPLRISGIPKNDLDTIQNIADNLDKSLTDFMRPYIRKIAESYPEEMRKTKCEDLSSEMKIRGIPKNVITWLENIASHMKVDVSSLMKPHLKEIIKSHPPKLKKPKI